jgi:hypothetical protein
MTTDALMDDLRCGPGGPTSIGCAAGTGDGGPPNRQYSSAVRYDVMAASSAPRC